jgi:hypothetical protein
MTRHYGGTANLVESYLLERDEEEQDENDDDDEIQMMQMIANMAPSRRRVPANLGGGSYYWFRASRDIYPAMNS